VFYNTVKHEIRTYICRLIMSKPSRPSSPDQATGRSRTFFVTTCAASGRALFQSERIANLLIDVLRSYARARKFAVHNFVVMPNHVHILLTLPGDISLEKAMQLIKGNFSFRAAHELAFHGEVWQRGFSDVSINNERSFRLHHSYINNNPVKAGLSNSPEHYPFHYAFLKIRKQLTPEDHP
jgi:putative transposase